MFDLGDARWRKAQENLEQAPGEEYSKSSSGDRKQDTLSESKPGQPRLAGAQGGAHFKLSRSRGHARQQQPGSVYAHNQQEHAAGREHQPSRSGRIANL